MEPNGIVRPYYVLKTDHVTFVTNLFPNQMFKLEFRDVRYHSMEDKSKWQESMCYKNSPQLPNDPNGKLGQFVEH